MANEVYTVQLQAQYNKWYKLNRRDTAYTKLQTKIRSIPQTNILVMGWIEHPRASMQIYAEREKEEDRASKVCLYAPVCKGER